MAPCLHPPHSGGKASLVRCGLFFLLFFCTAITWGGVYLERVDAIGGPKYGLALQGNNLFVREGKSITVLDASDPANLQKLNRVRTAEFPVTQSYLSYHSSMALAASDSLVFALGSYQGVEVWNLLNPQAPVRKSTIKAGGMPLCLRTREKLAFIGAQAIYTTELLPGGGPAGLFIYDVSAPASPKIVGSLLTTYPVPELEVFPGKAAFLSSMFPGASGSAAPMSIIPSNTISFVSIQNPSKPALTGYFRPAQGNLIHVAASGNLLYVSFASVIRILLESASASQAQESPITYHGVSILDTSKGTTATLLATLPMDDPPLAIAASGNLMAVWMREAGVRLYDVSKPSAPLARGLYATRRELRKLYLAGSKAWLLYEGDGVEILDVSNPAKPMLAGAFHDPSDVSDIKIHTYIPPDIVFSRDSGNPAAMGGFRAPDPMVHLAGSAGYQILDSFNPAAPRLVGTLPTTGSAHGVDVHKDRAFLAARGLHVIDYYTHSSSLTLLGRTASNWDAMAVAAHESIAYVGSSSGIRIIDATIPTLPVQVNYFNTSGTIQDLLVDSPNLYLASDRAGVYVLGIDHPTTPVLRSRYTGATEARGLALQGRLLLVADGEAGLKILDASKPSSLAPVGACDTPGMALAVAAVGNMACVADGWNGVALISIANPQHPRILEYCQTDGYARKIEPLGLHLYTAADGLEILRLKVGFIPTAAEWEGWNAYR